MSRSLAAVRDTLAAAFGVCLALVLVPFIMISTRVAARRRRRALERRLVQVIGARNVR